VIDERSRVEDTGDTQRTPEGASPLRQCDTGRIGVHVGTSPRKSASGIGDQADLFTIRDRDEPQQLRGRRTLPTTDAGAHRRPRATYHRRSLPCV